MCKLETEENQQVRKIMDISELIINETVMNLISYLTHNYLYNYLKLYLYYYISIVRLFAKHVLLCLWCRDIACFYYDWFAFDHPLRRLPKHAIGSRERWEISCKSVKRNFSSDMYGRSVVRNSISIVRMIHICQAWRWTSSQGRQGSI